MNYVNEQNMQEILDGIARKIGQGGTGNGLQDWESNTDYAIDDIFVLNNQIYKVLIDFTSGAIEGTATKINNIVPTAWTVNTSYTMGDIIEHQDSITLEYSYYDVTSNFTSGATFEVTAEMDEIELVEEYVPHHLTDAEKQSLISGFNPSGMGTSVQAVKVILWEGIGNILNQVLTLEDNYTNYDYIIAYMVDGADSVFASNILNPKYEDNLFIMGHNGSNGLHRAYLYFSTNTATINEAKSLDVYKYISRIEGIKFINPNNYSTEETLIGTWTDGKPLYQIVINTTTPNSSVEGIIGTLPSGANVVSFEGYYTDGDGNYSPLCVYGSPNPLIYSYVCINKTTGNINVKCYDASAQNCPCTIIAKYTKS